MEKIKCCHGPWFNNTGGVWIPFSDSEAPKSFLIADYTNDGVEEQANKNIDQLDMGLAPNIASKPARSFFAEQDNLGPGISDQGFLEKIEISE